MGGDGDPLLQSCNGHRRIGLEYDPAVPDDGSNVLNGDFFNEDEHLASEMRCRSDSPGIRVASATFMGSPA